MAESLAPPAIPHIEDLTLLEEVAARHCGRFAFRDVHPMWHLWRLLPLCG